MSKNEKENELVKEWYRNTVVEDQEDCNRIAGMATNECLRKWNIGIGVDDTPENVLAFYSIVFDTIMAELRKRQEKDDSFAINVANVVLIGYDNSTEDEDQEKQGNFCPFIQDIGKPEKPTEETNDSIERCMIWNSANIKEQKKVLTDIATNAVKNLHETVDLHLGTTEAVFPLFTTIHEQMVEYMKIKQAESSEPSVMINFAGNFDVYCRLLENGETVIEYSPKPSQKLGIKSDAVATSKDE